MRIIARNLSYVYPDGTEALKDIDLSIEDCESILIVGHNGAGKSTLLKHLIGILKPTSGEIAIGDRNTRDCEVYELVQRVALSFQNPDDQIFSSTVIDEVAFGPKNLEKKDFLGHAQNGLQLLELSEFADSHPYDLHSSKRKLLSIASAIAMDTPIVAFDEPTAGFDMRQKSLLRKAIAYLKEKKKTILIVSHDIDYFIELCDSVMILDGGRVRFHGTKKNLSKLVDLRSLLRTSGLSLPILWRMSLALGLSSSPSDVNEFASLLRGKEKL